MSTLGTEQGEILASFAEEIRPLLADVVGAVQRLADQPGDERVAEKGLTDLRTLQSVIGFLELENLQAVLGAVRGGLEALGAASQLSGDQQEAARQLATMLALLGAAIADGDATDDALDRARALTATLTTPAVSTSTPVAPLSQGGDSDINALLDTLGLDDVASPLSSADTEAPLPATTAFDTTVEDLLATLDGGETDYVLPEEPDVAPVTGEVADPLAAMLATLDDDVDDAALVPGPETGPVTGDAFVTLEQAPSDAEPEPVAESANVEAQAITQPLPVIDLQAVDPVKLECGRLLDALGAARREIAASAVDEGTMLDLRWIARAAKSAAIHAGHAPLEQLCDSVDRLVETLTASETVSDVGVTAFFTTAEEITQQFLDASTPDSAWDDMVALLEVQLASLNGGEADSVAGATLSWGELPPDVLAELDGVDIEALDDETLARISAMLEEFDAERAGGAAVDSVESVAAHEAISMEAAGSDPATVDSPAGDEFGAASDDLTYEGVVGVSLPEMPSESLPSDWVFLSDLGVDSPDGDVTERPIGADEDDDAAFEAEIRAVFLAEAEEHVAAINEAILELERRPDEPAPLAAIRRAVHTLKGASAAVGMANISQFCHAWEDALDSSDATQLSYSLLLECIEALERYLAHPDESTAAADFADLARRLTEITGGSVAETPPAVDDVAFSDLLGPMDFGELVESLPSTLEAALEDELASSEPAVPSAAAVPGDTLRVPVARVDALAGLVGELVVQRNSLVERIERLTGGVDDLDPILLRLRRIASDLDERFGYTGDLRGLPRPIDQSAEPNAEFDELEMDRYGEAYQLSREILELAADLATTRREIGHLLEDAQDSLVRQGRVTERLHEQLLDVRLVPVTLLAGRLQRTVRQAALASGKDVGFALQGGETLVDKALLEEIADPLLHLLRNAVDHGIEAAEDRQLRGKPEAGMVRVHARRDGKELVIQVQDDGAGIDPARVLARARERGLVATDTPDDPNLAHELIFTPGFSTATSVTGLSGRGIGLDVVRAHLAKAHGLVTVSSTLGQGTIFTLRLPSLLVVTPVLMVVAGGQRVALPLAQVRRILRTSREELTMVGDSPMLTLEDAPQPVRRLAEALGAPSEVVDEWPQQLLVAVVALGDGHTPLLVDEILGQHEAVVKAPAPPFDVLPGLAGTSVLGNGDVLLVLNVLELFGERVAPSTGLLPAPSAGAETWDEEPVDATGPLATPTVLVVDDSLSVRRVVSRTLTQHGWHVQEARDGLQALSMLRESRPDIMLLDVEMPRMDGFELTTTLKRDDTLRDLPIVMLTSRGGDKHRQKAADLGVDAYLVKPYQEATLLATLRRYARSSPRVSA